MQNSFIDLLEEKFNENLGNFYGKENYDEFRFGSYSGDSAFVKKLKHYLKKHVLRRNPTEWYNQKLLAFSKKYGEKLENVFNLLDTECQQLFVDIIAYRILGYQKIKLPTNSNFYHDAVKTAKKLKEGTNSIDPNFLNFTLHKYKLNSIGFDLEIYFTALGIAIDFILEQYALKLKTKTIQADPGDLILDLGGCWGDTALYFAHKTGDTGKVYSFEFIPNNVKIHQKNTSLNPKLNNHITLVQNPISSKSDQIVYYKDSGPASYISNEPFADQTGEVKTLSIDDFVTRYGINKVDFIKMDIEGVEQLALEGAIGTIKKFKPKLAIAIYHSMEDFVNIPLWVNALGLGYKLYLGHYTIHAEETILFAEVEN